jgi:hypothetical protein
MEKPGVIVRLNKISLPPQAEGNRRAWGDLTMKKLLISNCVILFGLVVTLFEIVGYTQSTDGPKQKPSDAAMSNNDNPALYFARVISASPATRDAYVACVQERELPIWGKLKRDGLLADVSVFEVTSVLTSERGVPSWNFLFLNHLAPSVTPAVFFDGEKKGEETSVGTKRCEDQVGAEVRPETASEKAIDANRRGIWTINASSLSEVLRLMKLDWGASLIPEHFR